MNSLIESKVSLKLNTDLSGRLSAEGGHLLFRLAPGETCEIVDIAVKEEIRRRGLGTAMLNYLLRLDKYKKLYAFTRADNVAAHLWYIKNGFKLHFIYEFYPDGHSYLCVRDRVIKHA